MSGTQTLMTGIVFGEQPRWHEDRLWFSDWGKPEVVAVDLEGNAEVMLKAPSFPCCVDWLPDGRLLLVSARDGLLLRREPDGSLVTHGDLNAGSDVPPGAEHAVWYGDVPNKRCVRVREGGDVLQTIELDRGCFACALGGANRSTLFMMATEWRGPENMFQGRPTGQVLSAPASVPGVGWP